MRGGLLSKRFAVEELSPCQWKRQLREGHSPTWLINVEITTGVTAPPTVAVLNTIFAPKSERALDLNKPSKGVQTRLCRRGSISVCANTQMSDKEAIRSVLEINNYAVK